MGIDEKPGQLKGDASVAKKDNGNETTPKMPTTKKTIDVVPPPRKAAKDEDSATAATSTTASSFEQIILPLHNAKHTCHLICEINRK